MNDLKKIIILFINCVITAGVILIWGWSVQYYFESEISGYIAGATYLLLMLLIFCYVWKIKVFKPLKKINIV